MRVLLICLDMDPFGVQGDEHTGAAHLYVAEVLQLLAQKGVPTLAVTRWDSLSKPEYEMIGDSVKLMRLPIGPVATEHKSYLWGRENECLRQVQRALDENSFSPSVIHAVYWYSGQIGSMLGDILGCPLVYSVVSLGKIKHQSYQIDLSSHDRAREEMEQRLFEQAKVIVSVCQQEKENLLRLYKDVPQEKILVVGRGIDPALFSPKAGSVDAQLREELTVKSSVFPLPARCLLFAGRLIESKGYEFLLRVYDDLLSDPTIDAPPLWILGGTPKEVERARSRAVVTRSLRKAEESGLIRWWGAVPRGSMSAFYRQAHMTCLPSRYEPAARVILESMACETPVIMTPTGYSDELVINGMNGYIAEHDDCSTWLLYIKAMLRDPVWRSVLGQRARRSVIPHFSLEAFWQRHWEAYTTVLDGTKNSRFFNPFISDAQEMLPDWTVPIDLGSTQTRPILTKITVADALTRKIQRPYHSIDAVPQIGNSSSTIFRCVVGNETYVAKRPDPKRLFYRVFYPTVGPQALFRSTEARWATEITFGNDPLFLPMLLSDEELHLIVRKEARKMKANDWSTDRVFELFHKVDAFHLRQKERWSELISLAPPKPKDSANWHDFFEHDRVFMELNSGFRAGAKWYSPTRLSTELLRVSLCLATGAWDLPEQLRWRLCDGLACLVPILISTPTLTIAWGECRPGHVVMSETGELLGIDAETCCISEPEIDYGHFLWWHLGLRESDDWQAQWNFVLRCMSDWCSDPITKLRSLGWMWLTSVHFIMWDLSRGHHLRFHRFEKSLEMIRWAIAGSTTGVVLPPRQYDNTSEF